MTWQQIPKLKPNSFLLSKQTDMNIPDQINIDINGPWFISKIFLSKWGHTNSNIRGCLSIQIIFYLIYIIEYIRYNNILPDNKCIKLQSNSCLSSKKPDPNITDQINIDINCNNSKAELFNFKYSNNNYIIRIC